MTDTIARSIESVRAFLPAEVGLRSHVLRVAALAGSAAHDRGVSPEQIERIELAGLLHHYSPDPETAAATRLLTDLGFATPSDPGPLPDAALNLLSQDLLAYVDSANLLDEQFEGLPYEDASTSAAVAELARSGMLSEPFLQALQSFRVASSEDLLAQLKLLSVDVAAGRWLPESGQEALLEHCTAVAEAASAAARQPTSADERHAYLAGMFHDVGRTAYLEPAVKASLLDWESLGFPATYAEFLVSGTDHAALGAQLLKSLEFPEGVVEAVEFHHRLELTGSQIAAMIYLAEDEAETLPSLARDHLAAS